MAQIAQIGGAILITTGAFLVYVPAGFIVGGLLAILIGITLESK